MLTCSCFCHGVPHRAPVAELEEVMSQGQRNKIAMARAAAQYAQSPGDTGSNIAQAAILTSRIQYMAQHMAKHKKDNHSMRGFQRMLDRRRKVRKRGSIQDDPPPCSMCAC